MWSQACELIEQAERMHRQFFRLISSQRAQAVWEPPADVFEDEHEVTIIIALPGVPHNRVEVSDEGGVLVVRAERRVPLAGPLTAVRQLEIPYGYFERRIPLPGARLKLGSEVVTPLILGLRVRLDGTPRTGRSRIRGRADATISVEVPAAAAEAPRHKAAARSLPEDALIIVPVRNVVLFPGMVIPLAVGRERSRAAAQEAVRLQRPLGVLLQSKVDVEDPSADDLHWSARPRTCCAQTGPTAASRHLPGSSASASSVSGGLSVHRRPHRLIDSPEQSDADIEPRFNLKQRD
jgi:HSP20 family molecular chaperone IbpA